MVQDGCIVMFNSKAHICKCCAFQNSWKKQMRTSHPTHLQERLMMNMRYTKAVESADLRGAGGGWCCSSLACPGKPMTCCIFNSLLCTLAVWVACLEGHACAQRGQRRTLFALRYPSLLHFLDSESLSEAKAMIATSKPQCSSLLCASHRKGYRCKGNHGLLPELWMLGFVHVISCLSNKLSYPLNYCSSLHSVSFFFSNVLASASLCPMCLFIAQPENSPAAVSQCSQQKAKPKSWMGRTKQLRGLCIGSNSI